MTTLDGLTNDSMFRAALDALDVPIIIHGASAILFANEAAARVLHASSADDLLGIDVSSIVHPDGMDAGRERRQLMLEQGHRMHEIPLKLRALDGTTLYAIVDGKRIEWNGRSAIVIAASSVERE